jgi:Flagellar hook-associated protein
VRDGNEGKNGSPTTKGIPYYISKLNEFVQTFAMSFNEGYVTDGAGSYTDGTGHADGYTLGSTTGPSGIRFFTALDSNGNNESSSTFIGAANTVATISNVYKNMTAKNFCVSDDILNSYKNISAAGAAGQQENATVLSALIDLRHNVNLFGEGSAEDYMKSLISNLGIDAQQANTLTSTQEKIVTQVENERQSVSGVSLDEEMSNMIKYQQTYNASARMITTMSQIYDTLINKLGV